MCLGGGGGSGGLRRRRRRRRRRRWHLETDGFVSGGKREGMKEAERGQIELKMQDFLLGSSTTVIGLAARL
jgi:hypothetical protein